MSTGRQTSRGVAAAARGARRAILTLMTDQSHDPADYDAYNSSELAEIYDVVYADRDDHAFWAAVAPGGGAILELACGTGRVLLPLARAGHEIVGLDLSAQMLERCRAHLADEPAAVRDRVRLVQADMTSFDWAGASR